MTECMPVGHTLPARPLHHVGPVSHIQPQELTVREKRGRSRMTQKRRDPFAAQLDLGLDAEPERPRPEGGRWVSGGESWLRRYSAVEPVPGRVLWPDGRVVRDDERQRILVGPQAHCREQIECPVFGAREMSAFPFRSPPRRAERAEGGCGTAHAAASALSSSLPLAL